MTRWKATTEAIYWAIYTEHKEEFKVFGSYTYHESIHPSERDEIMTEWGFVDSDFPLIRSHQKGGEWRYFIASIKDEED